MLGTSCDHRPPPPAGPLPVRAIDLWAAYRDDPGRADLAFTGQPVCVLCAAFRVEGSEVHVRFLTGRPPVVVLKFDYPPPADLAAPVWVTGTCWGQPAGPVLVTGCRISGPPSRAAP